MPNIFIQNRHAEGGSKFKWHEVQPKFKDAEADILLILDCCFSAQAGRGPSRQSRIELLAACPMDRMTPLPGPHSFTSALIKILESEINEKGHTVVEDVHRLLMHRTTKLPQSPIYVALSSGSRKKSIKLEPLRVDNGAGNQNVRNVMSSLLFKVSMDTPFERFMFPEIVEWLSLSAPSMISSVSVEQTVLKTARLHELIFEGSGETRSMTYFTQLHDKLQRSIQLRWQSIFHNFLFVSKALLFNGQDSFNKPMNLRDSTEAAESIFNDLDEQSTELSTTVENNLLALPNLYNKEPLMTAVEERTLQDLGFTDTLRIRLLSLYPQESINSMEIDSKASEIHKQSTASITLNTAHIPGLGAVLIEYKPYDPKYVSSSILQTAGQRIQQLAELLTASKSSNFLSLKCIHWFHQRDRKHFGLIFQRPCGITGNPISLYEILSKGKNRPTLEQKFAIARKIGLALQKWHAAAWVHQSVNSYNILFFCPADSSIPDYSNPYLCGFEYSRPSEGPSNPRHVANFEFNVYQHPDRQGSPTKRYRKEHDLYSYGILLTEIGLWNTIESIFPSNTRLNIRPKRMKEIILAHCKTRLAHHVGTSYQRAASICIEHEFEVSMDDIHQSQLAKAFQEKVLDQIAQGIKVG